MKDIEFIQTEKCFETQEKYENSSKYKYKEFCSCCGRGIKGEPKFWLNTIEGPSVVPFNTTEEEMKKEGLYTQGLFPIGSECKKRYPKEYVGTFPEYKSIKNE